MIHSMYGKSDLIKLSRYMHSKNIPAEVDAGSSLRYLLNWHALTAGHYLVKIKTGKSSLKDWLKVLQISLRSSIFSLYRPKLNFYAGKANLKKILLISWLDKSAINSIIENRHDRYYGQLPDGKKKTHIHYYILL